MMKKFKLYLKKNIVCVIESLSLPNVEFTLSEPKNMDFGDLSSNLPLLIGSEKKINPLEIGESIAQNLKEKCLENILEINVTPPGFINFKISQEFFQNKINLIIKNNENYGKGNIGSGKTANVEFVSANPTGPLTVGHGRNAILGDTISKILEWQNFKVTREYYYNDAGRQMRILGKSVEARYLSLIHI